MTKKNLTCPCQSGQSANLCCLPFIQETAIPANAEALMRSRYSAYALGKMEYLQKTWHPTTRPPISSGDEDGVSIKWIGLTILEHHTDGDTATVSFVATCKVSGRLHRMQEISRFVREDARWWYLDGEIINV